MCGRFTLISDKETLSKRFNIYNMKELPIKQQYNIAPSQSVLAIVNDGEKNKGGFLRWGLVPSWAKEASIGYKMINARAETITEKASFKRLIQHRRCLIIADSFYEWKKNNDTKIPYRITLQNNQPFAFAGLWDRWEKDGEIINTCTIITTKANRLMQNIHHRMPVILTKEAEKNWLDRSIKKEKDVLSLLVPYASDDMEYYQVSTTVNSPKNDNPQCIEPIS